MARVLLMTHSGDPRDLSQWLCHTW